MRRVYKSIADFREVLEICKSLDEVKETVAAFPSWSGQWYISTVQMLNGKPCYVITNQYFDEQCGEICDCAYYLRNVKVEEEID